MRKEFAEKNGTTLWGAFAEILDAIDEGDAKIAIRSNNGSGKTHFLAAIAAYEAYEAQESGNPVTIIVTSATATQLNNAFWPELKRALRAVKGLTFHAIHKKIEGNHFKIIGINPAKIESGQGYHDERVVILIDEAAAFNMEMMNALTSNATGSNCLTVITFNPTDPDCAAADIERQGNWKTFVLSAFNHPNVISGVEEIKGAVTREFVESILHMSSVLCSKDIPEAINLPWNGTWWQPTPEALARVCGKYSLAISHGFIPMSEILMACKAEVKNGMRVMGLDVASTGEDSTVAAIFDGNEQKEFRTIKTGEFRLIAEWVCKICLEENITLVGIDDTGIGNAVTERLNESSLSALLIPIHFAAKPKGFEKLRNPANARAEMYFCLEKEIRSKSVKLFYETHYLKELSAPRIVRMKNSEALRLEDKALVRKRIGRSPDKADATAIARYAVRLLQFFNQPRML